MPGFDELWQRYPNKSSRKDAQKAYTQLVTSPEREAEIHQALDWQLPHWKTMSWYHPPYLATYLRRERFKDAPQGAQKPPGAVIDRVGMAAPDAIAEALETRRRRAEMLAQGMSDEAIEALFDQEYEARRQTRETR